MGNRSKIAQLPPKLREEVDRLIRDQRATIDEIVAHLRTLHVEDISRTAVGDYKKRMESSLARYREAQEVAGTWVRDLGESADSKTGQLLAELLKTIAFRTLADMQDQNAGAEPEELMLLARAIKDMAGAQKTDIEFRSKLRAQYKAELAERATAAADEVTKVTKAAGLSAAAVDAIRTQILGIPA